MKETIFNPLKINDKVKESYTNFFLDNFFVQNQDLINKFKKDIGTEKGFLSNGPYVSLSPQYEKSKKTAKEFLQHLFTNKTEMINASMIADCLAIPYFFNHQEEGIKNVLKQKRNTIVSTGTGSGKSLIYFIPILTYILNNPEKRGVKAIISYPMNALANDQLDLLKNITYKIEKKCGKKITFGIYIGDTPNNETEPIRWTKLGKKTTKIEKMATSCIFNKKDESFLVESSKENIFFNKCIDCIKKSEQAPFIPDEIPGGSYKRFRCNQKEYMADVFLNTQIITRDEMRENPPDILITNFSMMEFLLLRNIDQSLFNGKNIKYLVLDEAHTFVGAKGAHVALQLRRLLNRLNKYGNEDPICIATSATLTKYDKELSFEEKDAKERKSISDFGSQLFGRKFDGDLDIIKGDIISEEPPSREQLKNKIIKDFNINIINNFDEISEQKFEEICNSIANGEEYKKSMSLKKRKEHILYDMFRYNQFFWDIFEYIKNIISFKDLCDKLREKYGRDVSKNVWEYLYLASLAENPNTNLPLVSLKVHLFVRPPRELFICPKCNKLFDYKKELCDACQIPLRYLGVCHGCGNIYYGIESDEEVIKTKIANFNSNISRERSLGRKPKKEKEPVEGDNSDDESDEKIPIAWFVMNGFENPNMRYCLQCGQLSLSVNCEKCSTPTREIYLHFGSNRKDPFMVKPCNFCDNQNHNFSIVTKPTQSFEVTSRVLFEILYRELEPKPKKLLLFTDSVQFASALPANLEYTHIRDLLTQITVNKVRDIDSISYPKLFKLISSEFIDGQYFDELKQKRIGTNYKSKNRFLNIGFKEVLKINKKRINAENYGVLEVDYEGLNHSLIKNYIKEYFNEFSSDEKYTHLFYILSRLVLDEIRNRGIIPTAREISESTLAEETKYPTKILFIGSDSEAIQHWRNKGYNFDDEKDRKFINRFKQQLTCLYCDPGSKFEESNWLKNIIEKCILLTKVNINYKKIGDSIINFLIKNEFLINNNFSSKVHLPDKYLYSLNLSKVIFKKPQKIFMCDKCYSMRYYNTFDKCFGLSLNQKEPHDGNLIEIDPNKFVAYKYYRQLFTSKPEKMIVREDTAKDEDRRETEIGFKDGDVNVVVSTPTLELGVDIGDLNVIGLLRTPPSPSNYVQRIGRAGRKNKISLAITLIKDEVIDNYYYDNPIDIIDGKINDMALFLDNKILIKHHAYSLILENLSSENKLPNKFIDFITNLRYFNELNDYIQKNKDKLVEEITNTFQINFEKEDIEISHDDIKEIVDKFPYNFRTEALEKFKKEYENLLSCQSNLEEREKRIRSELRNPLSKDNQLKNQLKSVQTEIWERDKTISEMKEASTIAYLSDINFLPDYAFPSNVINLMAVPRDNQRDQFISNRDYEFYPKSKNIAINQFAPRMKIFYRKNVYQCLGINEPSEQKNVNYLFCDNCKSFYTDNNLPNDMKCSCGKQLIFKNHTFKGISPTKMIVQWSDFIEERIPKDTYVESDAFVKASDVSFSDNPDLSHSGFSVNKPRQSIILNTVMLTYEGNKHMYYKICEKCGRLLTDKDLKKKTHKSISYNSFGAEPLEDEDCNGDYITNENANWDEDKIYITNEFSTRVLRVSLRGENNPKNQLESKNYLLTLKNALISASQIITQAEDGEIDGVVSTSDNSIILYDNLEGGVGYVDLIYKNFNKVLNIIKSRIDPISETSCRCDFGCPSCIMSSRRRHEAKFIDKRLIIPFFEKNEFSVNEDLSVKNMDGISIKRPEIIWSESGELIGYDKIKDTINSSKKEVNVISMYISDDQLNWDKEGKTLSWLDILISKKIKDKIPIKVIVRPPNYQDNPIKRQIEIRRLLSNHIDVRIFEKELQGAFRPSIAHDKEIIVDPYFKEGKTFYITGNLGFETFKNRDRIEIYNDLTINREAKLEFDKLWQQSRDITPEDLEEPNYEYHSLINEEDREKIKLKVGGIINEAKEEILIVDPYLTKLDSFEFLKKWWPKQIKTKILTAFCESKDLIDFTKFLKLRNNNYEIIRYLDTKEQKTPLHSRYIIIDNNRVIYLDKGLNSIFGYTPGEVTIFYSPNLAKTKKRDFDYFFHQKNCPSKYIRDFPTDRYSNE